MAEAKQRRPSGNLATNRPNSREEAVLDEGGIRCESVLYDFDEDGGDTGDVEFNRNLPAGAIVTKIFSDELTAFTSGGSATVQIKADSTDLTDAIAFDTGFSGTEEQALASSAEAIKVSSSSELKMTIAGAALTAGKCRFFVQYLLPND